MRNRRDGSCPVFIVSSDPCPPPPLMQRTLSGWHQTRCGFPGPGPSPHSLSLQLKRIGMDLIGPLERSARRHRFALVLVDYATRYPEAVPLRTISAKSVADALFIIISRVGIPKEILTDQGTVFMSRTLRELYEPLGIKSIRTSVYHPQTDSLVERLNRTLKSMVRKFVKEDAKNKMAIYFWDKWLEPLLFAVQEVPQASTGFSPFSMVVSPGGCLTSLERLGRRGLQIVVVKFSMSWTSEQNSTP